MSLAQIPKHILWEWQKHELYRNRVQAMHELKFRSLKLIMRRRRMGIARVIKFRFGSLDELPSGSGGHIGLLIDR